MGECNNHISGSAVLELLTREELYKLYKRVEKMNTKYSNIEKVAQLRRRGKTLREIALIIGVSYVQVSILEKQYDNCSTHYDYYSLLRVIKNRVNI